MHRRFLNLVMHDNIRSIGSLHRMDLRRLFYETVELAEQATAANAKKKNPLRALSLTDELRKPLFSFQPHNFFTQLRESSIVMVDSSGSTTIFDTDFNLVLTGDSMRHGKGPNCVCFSTPHHNTLNSYNSTCLFVLDLVPGNSSNSTFDVPRYVGSDDSSKPLVSSHFTMNWFWSRRPVPPFVDDPAYSGSTKMCSSMVLGKSTICVSSMEEGVGTYTFDPVSEKWSWAGSWVLPFCGNAEYVPEVKLWFALSASSPHGLCALDLPAMGSELPPELQCTWDYLHLPEQSPPYRRHLLKMGSGRFCIISFFRTLRSNGVDEIIEDESAVFTGVEVRPCNGGERPVRMINHMSKRYTFGKYRINCVL
ncbi:unnamed protein product [Alopecurus aequalis]